jgi:hypothetical protein
MFLEPANHANVGQAARTSSAKGQADTRPAGGLRGIFCSRVALDPGESHDLDDDQYDAAPARTSEDMLHERLRRPPSLLKIRN